MSYGTVQANLIQGSVNSFSPNSSVFRNRIINGAMVIDQRNAGASISTSSTGNQIYSSLDRWAYIVSQASKFTMQQNAGSVTPPAGFTNYLGCTSTAATSVGSSDYFQFNQIIEGFNIADLNWGTANAKTITVSFWVRSSLTGTFGGALRNSALDRSYPFTYTISAANTWEQKSVTIAGDTSGTWVTNNGIGIRLNFSLGMGSTFSGTAGAWAGSNLASATGATSVVGTNGATFYITGVQLEVGSTATSFDYRPYGTELALCQRYYYKVSALVLGDYLTETGFAVSTTAAFGINKFPVTMRIAPTALEQSGTAGHYQVVRCGAASATTCSSVPIIANTTPDRAQTQFTVASGLSNGTAGQVNSLSTSAYLAWSAEL